MCFLMIFFIEILLLCNMYFVRITIINADCPRDVMLPRLDGHWRAAKINYNNYNYNYYNYNNIYAYSYNATTQY